MLHNAPGARVTQPCCHLSDTLSLSQPGYWALRPHTWSELQSRTSLTNGFIKKITIMIYPLEMVQGTLNAIVVAQISVTRRGITSTRRWDAGAGEMIPCRHTCYLLQMSQHRVSEILGHILSHITRTFLFSQSTKIQRRKT